jgi:hypothetical protein
MFEIDFAEPRVPIDPVESIRELRATTRSIVWCILSPNAESEKRSAISNTVLCP